MTNQDRFDYAALTLRVSLGVMFIAHAWLKYSVFTLAGTAQFFESLGLPGFMAYLIFTAELGGGIALILGAYVSLVSVALIPILLGATWVHVGNGWLFSAEGGGWEYPVFLVAASVAQALMGAGKFALRLPLPSVLGKLEPEQA